ncbi:MAG: hypothetical protein FHK80_02380 [Azoarcus sp. PHD]|nr:MAG: hypothetical protein FHK80_02380 [Azoarcus sp. PHD]
MFPSDKEGFAPEFDARVLKSRLSDYVFDPVTDYLLLHQDVDVETVELRLGEVATSFLAGLDYEHVPNQLATKHQRIYFDHDIEIDGSRLILSYSRARRAYIQDMLAQNRNRITDVLTDILADIKSHIRQLVSSIDQAFKYSVVNETWNVSLHEPGGAACCWSRAARASFRGTLAMEMISTGSATRRWRSPSDSTCRRSDFPSRSRVTGFIRACRSASMFQSWTIFATRRRCPSKG